MSLSTILVKIFGVLLLAWTARSIFKHIKDRKKNPVTDQSITEQILNNLLLYLWLAFCTIFSIGMIVNN
jgi:hypothetical protein